MTIATVVSITAFYGVFGPTAKALSAFVALAVALIAAPLIAYATDGKYYIARSRSGAAEHRKIQCCICEHSFEPRTPRPVRPMPARSAPVLFAGRALPGSLQPHARAAGGNVRGARQIAAQADLREDQFAARPYLGVFVCSPVSSH